MTVAFFDRTCGFCNAWVDWILARDSAGKVRFAPLQGKTAEAKLTEKERLDLDTIVVLKNDRIFKMSTAVLEVLLELPQPWSSLGSTLLLVPRPIRDGVYRTVARHRHKIFGKSETCRLPTPDERSRFFD